MTPRNPLLPTIAQCQSLTDEQCRMIQDILDPQGIRAYNDWETLHQTQLVKLYMTGMSFNQIENTMKRRGMDCSYKTYNNRFRAWNFPTTQAAREKAIVGLYATVSNQNNPATTETPLPSETRMLLPIRPSPTEQTSQVPTRAPVSQPLLPFIGESSQHRNSISTIDTLTSSSGSSAYTHFDDTFSNPRFSVATTNSSVSSESQSSSYPALSKPKFQPQVKTRRPPKHPKHDSILGLWNDTLRVIPCGQDHSRQMWNDGFTRCDICGFSQWHALMVHARSYRSSDFLIAIGKLGVFDKHDFAGNFPIHFLMSAGVGMDYFVHLLELRDSSGQNAFGQNPLHVLNPQDLEFDDNLISFLEYFNRLDGGVLLSQRDICCMSPLQTLLQRPLEQPMYQKILKTFPCALISLCSLNTSGRCVMEMMENASVRMKRDSQADWRKIQDGIVEVERFLTNSKSQQGVQDYGFHEIARGQRGNPIFNVYQCRICNQTCDQTTHSASYFHQMECAWRHNRDINSADEKGFTPAHLLITIPRCNLDGSPETPSQTAALFRILLPRDWPNLREALHILDPEGNSLVFHIATRGFYEILDYVLNLEDQSRWSAMVNVCSKRPKAKASGKEWSVLEAVEEKIKDLDERLKYAHLTMSARKIDSLCEEGNRLKLCRQILKRAGAQLKPSITTRYKICK